jgi:hypothetical protein
MTALRHYTNLDETLNRLRRLVSDFGFDAIEATLTARGAATLSTAATLAHAD